jgi:hypothetical protein
MFTYKRGDETLRNNDEREGIKKERTEIKKCRDEKGNGQRIEGRKKGVTLILRNEDIREG